jgi:hypothetical protein
VAPGGNPQNHPRLRHLSTGQERRSTEQEQEQEQKQEQEQEQEQEQGLAEETGQQRPRGAAAHTLSHSLLALHA